MENKVLIIEENKSIEHKEMIEKINKFKYIQEQLKAFKEWEKKLKDEFKKYNFEKVVITSESGNTTFSITQYTQERKELDKEKMIDVIEAYIRSDLGMGDEINDKSIPLRRELEEIVENAHETKTIKCVKYNVK